VRPRKAAAAGRRRGRGRGRGRCRHSGCSGTGESFVPGARLQSGQASFNRGSCAHNRWACPRGRRTDLVRPVLQLLQRVLAVGMHGRHGHEHVGEGCGHAPHPLVRNVCRSDGRSGQWESRGKMDKTGDSHSHSMIVRAQARAPRRLDRLGCAGQRTEPLRLCASVPADAFPSWPGRPLRLRRSTAAAAGSTQYGLK